MASTVAHPIQRLGIPVDVTLLNGTFTLANPDGTAVPMTDETVRLSEPRTVGEYKRPEAPDFNFDDEEDHLSELGSFPHPEGAPADAPPLYGVWFSPPDEDKKDAQGIPLTDTIENGGEPIPPDLVRVALQEQNFDDIGLLESISFEDLTDTDLYIFRQSTGELVMEKSPFLLLDPDGALSATPDVVYGNGINGIAADGVAFFEASIPGRDNQHDFRHVWADKDSYDEELAKPENENKQYNAWQATQFVEADFRGDTDSLRVGEPLRVIVINRATGYIGGAETAVQALELQNRASTLGVTLPPLALYPPNLKLSVERQYQVARGLTKGETRRYGIGSEGSALHSDQFVKISTDWRAADGRALPKDLPGFTGRLVSLVADQTLGESSVNHFAIAPGLNTEVIKLPNDGSAQSAGYQYLHVVGAKDIDAADFGTSDATRNRPENYVPIQVAVYDAEDSRALKQAQLEAASQTDSGEGNLEQDSSVYRWPYRPEMMYSVFDLDIKKITRTPEGEDSEAIDITDSENPTLVAGDTDLSIVQDLIASEYDPLEYFGPDSHLVYSLEGYQQQVHAGTDQTYSFSEFGHLGELNGEDFLTLNLLNSQDAGNVLWEWAFEYAYLRFGYVDSLNEQNDEGYIVTADNTEIELVAGTIGRKYEKDGAARTVGLRWRVEGDGTLERYFTYVKGQSGYKNILTMDTEAGSTATVYAWIEGDKSTEMSLDQIYVVPGHAAVMELKAEGKVGLANSSKMSLVAKVADKHGNPVPDNTAVGFTVDGHASASSPLVYTSNGEAQVDIRGGYSSGDQNVVIVDSGDAIEELIVDVLDPLITVAGLTDNIALGSSKPITVTVKGPEGSNASEVIVAVSTTHGYLNYFNSSYLTNAEGQVSFNWDTGTVATDEAVLTIKVGDKQLYQSEHRLVLSTDDPETGAAAVSVSKNRLIVVGDESTAGSTTYGGIVNSPAVNAPIDFETVDSLVVNRANDAPELVGDAVELALGSVEYPNRNPALALDGSRTSRYSFQDDTGAVTLKAKTVQKVADNPSGWGSSLQFTPTDNVSTHASEISAQLPDATTIDIVHMDMKITEFGGSLLKLGNWLSLTLNTDGRLQLQAAVGDADETAELTTAALSAQQWYSVKLQLATDSMNIWVGQTHYQLPLALDKPVNRQGQAISIGKNYSGKLAAIRLYDSGSLPLLTFENGNESTALPLEKGAEQALTVIGQARLKSSVLSNTQARSVALAIGDQQVLVDVISKQRVRKLSSLLRDTIAPSLDWAGFKPYYAAGPRASGRHIYERVLNVQSDRQRTGYRQLDETTALLALFNTLPRAAELSHSIEAILKFLTQHESDNRLQAAIAQQLYQHVEPLARGVDIRFDKIAVPLKVLSEVIESSPLAAQRLASSIRSEADYETWTAFMSLPADGWIGVYPPIPSLNSNCADDRPILAGEDGSIDLPYLACRAKGEQVADLINDAWDNNSTFIEYPELATDTLRQLLTVLPVADTYVRAQLFPQRRDNISGQWNFSLISEAHAAGPLVYLGAVVSRAALRYTGRAIGAAAGSVAAGFIIRAAVKQLVAGYVSGENSRVHPILMMGAVGYLQSRIDEDCTATNTCVPIEFDDGNQEGIIASLTKKVAAQPLGFSIEEITAKGNIRCAIDADGHGAAFELWAAANMHMRFEFLSQPESELIGMQVFREVAVRQPNAGKEFENRLIASNGNRVPESTYRRFADLLIAGDGKKSTLVELKSYRVGDSHVKDAKKKVEELPSKALVAKTPLWNATKTGTTKTTMHRQILLDAMSIRDQIGVPDDEAVTDDFVWYFQSWTQQFEDKKLNASVGVSLADVKVTKGKDKYEGTDFIARRLSPLSSLVKKHEQAARWMAFNLGLPKESLNLRESGYPDRLTLYRDTGSKGRAAGDGGLKDRIRPFGLFGDVSPAQRNDLLRQAFGLNPESDFVKLLLGEETLDWVEEVKDHVGNMENTLEELAESVIDKDALEAYSDQLDEFEEQVATIREELVEASTAVLPQIPESEQKCQ